MLYEYMPHILTKPHCTNHGFEIGWFYSKTLKSVTVVQNKTCSVPWKQKSEQQELSPASTDGEDPLEGEYGENLVYALPFWHVDQEPAPRKNKCDLKCPKRYKTPRSHKDFRWDMWKWNVSPLGIGLKTLKRGTA